MNHISEKDIDAFSLLSNFFDRAINDQNASFPLQTAEAVLVNIVSRADAIFSSDSGSGSGSGNFESALHAVQCCLSECIRLLENAYDCDPPLAEEIKEIQLSYTPL